MYVGKGTNVGDILSWDGSKWIAGPGGNMIQVGALAQSVIAGTQKCEAQAFSQNLGALGNTNFAFAVVVGASDIPAYSRTDSFLGQPWTGSKTSVTTAGTNVLIRNSQANTTRLFLGNTAKVGGFYYKGRFGLPASWVSTQSTWIGFRNLATNPTGGATANTFVDMMGVGHDIGDTNLQLMANDGSGTATKVDTGMTLAAKTGWDVEMWADMNSSTVYYKVTNIITGATYSNSIASNTPTVNLDLQWQVYATNGVTAVTASVAYGSQYYEYR